MVSKLSLEGLRVIDLSWVQAGPFATKMLADMGAEVIKIETYHKVDGFRVSGPWKDKTPTPPNRSGDFDSKNANKLSMLLNLRVAAGVEIFKRLLKVSDVVIENFTAGTMDRFGLEYSVLRDVNPKIIVVSMAGFGQTGPYSNYVSFGPTLQSISGLSSITGFPGHDPLGLGIAYPDSIGGLFADLAILAGLRHRQSGKGQYIDLSQYEAAVSVLGHTVLEYTVNNRVPQPVGNRHPYASPYGCYRCKGDDRWCVIAVYTEEEWKAFCNVIGNPDWTKSSKFATLLGRKRSEGELDRLVEGWTIGHSAEEVMELMQGAGVAAGIVQNIEDLITRDPHMKARGFYQEIEHPPLGKVILEGIPFKLSLTPGSLRTPAPLLGQHTDYVLKRILGMPQEEIDRFAAEGAFE